LGGLAVLVVVALAVVITVLVVRPSGGGPTPTPTNGNSDFASANDTGPVNIIAEDPTCEAWGRVAREYSDKTKTVHWGDRDVSVPAGSWTPEQRTMYETVSNAMTRAADQTTNLVKQTPHRVMRELYLQFIAYKTAFVQKIPTYVAADGNLAVVPDTIVSALANICSAIDYRSAQPIAPLVSVPTGPSAVSPPPDDPAAPTEFLSTANPICPDWASMVSTYDDETTAWLAIDPNVPVAEWTPEQKSINDAVAPVMSKNADEVERLGRKSGNPTLEDIAVLAAQYRRGYVVALPNYAAVDNFLAQSATYLVKIIDWACKAAG
jgi:hypothetical protein